MSADSARPGTIRPGGRTARVRATVLRAVGDVLAERGFAHLDLPDIARRAGVGKTTIYRRWGSEAGLVADLLKDMAEQSSPRARTGTLAGDLKANARLVQRTLADPRQGALFRAVIAAATCDTRTAEALHRFYDIRIKEWAPCVQEAVALGQLPEHTDAREVIRAVSAPLYYRMLMSGDPLDEAAADRAAEAAAAAARAGAFIKVPKATRDRLHRLAAEDGLTLAQEIDKPIDRHAPRPKPSIGGFRSDRPLSAEEVDADA